MDATLTNCIQNCLDISKSQVTFLLIGLIPRIQRVVQLKADEAMTGIYAANI